MDWRHFLIANAAGSVLWAMFFGLSAFVFDRAILQVTGPLSIGLLAVATAIIIGAALFVRLHGAELEAKAESALPGPLRPVHPTRPWESN